MLPELHYISQGNTTEEHLVNIRNACTFGAELVQLRLKGFTNKEVLRTAEMARKSLTSWQIIGGTANTIQDCNALISEKVAYIGLGPFRFTTTKKQLSPVLEYNGYMTLIEALNAAVPIIAVGGITLKDIPKIMETGVYGIAASGEITKDFNNIKHFNLLIKGTELQEQIWMPDQENT
jgi:thiamine-phosphate pyrophosphorylase